MNVATMLEWAARRYADRVAFTQGPVSITYHELDERANRLANGLIGLGLERGERVAIMVGNQIEYAEAEFAVTKAGGVRTPILIRSSVQDVSRILQAADARLVIASPESLEILRKAAAAVEREVVIMTIGGDAGSGELDYERLLSGSSGECVDVDLNGDDLYALRFTGGTTGRPKGVLMSHRTMSTVIANMLLNWPIDEDDVVVHFHPLSHAAGMIMYPWHIRGARQIIMPAFDFKPELLLETIERERGTAMFMIPTVLNILLDSALLDQYDTSSLRTIVYGGAPPPLQRIRQGLAAFGPVFVQLYGTSEAPNILTTLQREEHVFSGDEPPRRLRSAGRVGLGVEVRVVREDGTECQPEEVGEIVSRGDHTMVGYWKDPELTAERVKDGWVFTRDMGMFDAEGYLYIVDRKDDMIISGGFNIWPAEIEDVLYEHADVREAAVFGVEDPKWGEAVVAAVYLTSSSELRPEELQAFVRERVARHKTPKHVWLRTEPIQKSAVGKPLRRHVRDEFLRLQGAREETTTSHA
jgi:acyl-CoA synthetase (AMP-forming)/AMP-acid ligase II